MSGVTCNLPLRVHSTRLINVRSAWKRKSRNPSYSLKRSVKLNHTSQETVNLALGPAYHENGLRMRLEKNFPRTWCAESQHLSTAPPSTKINTKSISWGSSDTYPFKCYLLSLFFFLFCLTSTVSNRDSLSCFLFLWMFSMSPTEINSPLF